MVTRRIKKTDSTTTTKASAAELKSAPKSTSTAKIASKSATPDAVAARAFEIWKREGSPAGREVEHWLQAEKELSQGA